MYNPLSDDKVVQCPYNKNHTIPRSNLQRHLVRCEKNYGADYKIICPYNATHRLSKLEIAEHIETCPTRRVVEAYHIERDCIPASAKQKDESSFASTVEDSWEKQIGTYKSDTRFAYVNQKDESERDDLESFVSSVGMGRGKRIPKNLNTPIKLRFAKSCNSY